MLFSYLFSFVGHSLSASLNTPSAKSSVFYIFNNKDKPDKTYYEQFYRKNDIRLIDTTPKFVTDNVSFVDFYILSSQLSGEFGGSHPNGPADLMKHNGIGFRLFNQHKQEIRRISISYWACLAEKADYPYLRRSQIHWWNRAIVGFTTSSDSWEGGYWNEEILLHRLSYSKYKTAWDEIQDFADHHPYIAGYEIWSQQKLVSPAVTCNTFVQSLVWKLTARDVYKERILAVAYAVVIHKNSFDDAEEETRLRVVNYWLPRWYNQYGNVVAINDVPELHLSNNQNFVRTYLRSNVLDNFNLLPWSYEQNVLPWILA